MVQFETASCSSPTVLGPPDPVSSSVTDLLTGAEPVPPKIMRVMVPTTVKSNTELAGKYRVSVHGHQADR